MKLQALRGGVSTVYVEVEGEEEKVQVDYQPGNLTFDLGEQIQAAVDAGKLTDAHGLLKVLEELLVDWDLEEDILDDEGNPTGEVRRLTTKAEDLKKVPIPFLGLVFQKIQEASVPNAESGPNSGGTLPQTEQSAPSPNGTSSFGPLSDTESLPGN